MNYRTQLLCTWAGPLYVVLFCLGLLVAGFIPPPSPSLGIEELAAIYIDRKTNIQVGMLIVMAAQGLFAIFVAELTVQLRRIEGPHSPLAYAQLALGVLAVLLVILPSILQEVATFRPQEHSPQTLRLLTDITWIPFVGAWFTVVPQWTVTGVAILQDQRPKPIFPRWSGYVNFCIVVLSLPSTGLYFLKTGPFAWNGLLSFWLAAAAFFAWTIVMAVLLIRAIKNQLAETPTSQEQ